MSITSKGIYYPDDYTHVADVPEDFKKLAESVNTAIEDLDTNKVDKVDGKGLSTNDFTNEDKAKLDGLNNYDDTEIKQEIEDIQEEQAKQNEDIEDLKQINAKQDDLIQKLKDNSINVTTEEATSLHITDASTVPAKLDVRGNQRQETREGYNVLRNKLTSNTINGVTFTINEDKSVTLNGTATNSIITNLITGKYDDNNATNPLIIPEDITNYRLSGCPSGGSGSTYKLDIYSKNNILIGTDFGEGIDISKNSGGISELARVRIIVYEGVVLSNVTFYPMITYGTEEKEYKPYYEMPSLDYPSEVEAVGDNVNILPNNAVSTSHNGVNYTINEDGSIYAVGTATSNSQVILAGQLTATEEVFKFKKGIQYKNVGNVRITYRKTDGNYGQISPSSILAPEEDISIGCLYIEVVKNYSVDILYYPKIVEYYEGMNESYSPYGQGSVEIKKINKNFYDLNVEGISRNGVDYSVENGIVTAKRTATSSSGSYFNTNRVKLPAGTYIISGTDDTFVYANARVEVYKSDTIDGNSTQITTLMNTRLSYKYTSDKPFYLSFSVVITGATAVNDTFIFKPQAEKGNVASDYAKHEESSYILDIQKPMLSGDYFVKEADGWKEVHGWNKYEFTGEENITYYNAPDIDKANTASTAYFTIDLPKLGENDATKKGNVFCNCFSNIFDAIDLWGSSDNEALSKEAVSLQRTLRIRINKTRLINYSHDMTSTEKVNLMKQYLTERYNTGNPIYVYYKLATPTKLPCTEAQSKVLDQLNELELFKGTNNIITAESLALMQMQYIADTVTYIDNRIDEKLANINQQILEIAGGN